MRKAVVAGVSVLVLVVAGLVFATTAWTQVSRPPEPAGRRMMVLDGRGSAIGVSIRDLDKEDAARAKLAQPGGVVVEEVDGDGPAARAGIQRGDVIVEFDGERVRSARQLSRVVRETPEGRSVSAVIVRDGRRESLQLTPEADGRRFEADVVIPDIHREIERGLEALPRHFSFDFNIDDWPGSGSLRGSFGLALSPLSNQLAEYFGAKRGVLVAAVRPDSPAAEGGLKAGDVITSIGGETVGAPHEVHRRIRDAEPGAELSIEIVRDKKPATVKAQMPERPRERRFTRPA